MIYLRICKDSNVREVEATLARFAQFLKTGPLRLRCRLDGVLIAEELPCD